MDAWELEDDMSKRDTQTAVEWLDPQCLNRPEWSTVDKAGRGTGVLLGHYNGESVGSTDDRHIMTVVGAGGRGVQQSLIVPNLLHFDGSMLVVDPSGELARATARARREMGQRIVVLDPFGVSGIPTGSFNPVDALDPASPTVVDDAASLAALLIVGGDLHDPHWRNGARMLVTGAILLALTFPEKDRNLVMVQQVLSGDCEFMTRARQGIEADNIGAFIAVIRSHDKVFDGALANIGMTFEAMSRMGQGTIFATALMQLGFLRSPALKPVLDRSTTTLVDLRETPTTYYVCLPISRMGSHSCWLRMIVGAALAEFERKKITTTTPVLVVLNEFAALPNMATLEAPTATMTECSVRLWFVLQSLDQLKSRYPHGWQTLVANTGVMTFWQNSDPGTLGFIAERTGMTVLELERLLASDTQSCMVLPSGQPPLMLQRHDSTKDAMFASRCDA
jgi:type IV secretion system protein VirD4